MRRIGGNWAGKFPPYEELISQAMKLIIMLKTTRKHYSIINTRMK